VASHAFEKRKICHLVIFEGKKKKQKYVPKWFWTKYTTVFFATLFNESGGRGRGEGGGRRGGGRKSAKWDHFPFAGRRDGWREGGWNDEMSQREAKKTRELRVQNLK
jgi:hypothetical protein